MTSWKQAAEATSLEHIRWCLEEHGYHVEHVDVGGRPRLSVVDGEDGTLARTSWTSSGPGSAADTRSTLTVDLQRVAIATYLRSRR